MAGPKKSAKGATPSRRTVLQEPTSTSKSRGAEDEVAVSARGSRRKAAAAVSYKEEDESANSSIDGGDDQYQDGSEDDGDEKAGASGESDLSEEELDSDDLDATLKKRKRGTSQRDTAGSKRKRDLTKKKQSSKKQKTGKQDSGVYSQDEDDSDDESVELEEGQTFAGKIVSAPKTGHVPPGQISRNTMKFLDNLQYPERNDREWFKLHDPSYRLAEKEWVAFVQTFIPKMRGVDNELPMVPPKDLIHRIYRDVRFSNDKTPYKRHFSASFTRSGRKGIWAGYFISSESVFYTSLLDSPFQSIPQSVQPRNKSILAGGVWGPGKNELSSIRHAITQDSGPLREILTAKTFTDQFGKFQTSGERSNVFGHSDALKTAPRGMAKDHPDIELLKLRFPDEQVLQPNFMEHLLETARAIQPLIAYLNSIIALPAPAADT